MTRQEFKEFVFGVTIWRNSINHRNNMGRKLKKK